MVPEFLVVHTRSDPDNKSNHRRLFVYPWYYRVVSVFVLVSVS